MIIRLSQKLNQKINAGTLRTLPLDENPYADWSAHLFTANRVQYIILCNTPSLYSCVMFGAGITSDSRFIERALANIRDNMEDDGLPFLYHKFVAPASATVSFAKALNRSVTGSMNDLILGAKHHLTDDIAPSDVGIRLNETPLSMLVDTKGQKYANPRHVFVNLLAGEKAE